MDAQELRNLQEAYNQVYQEVEQLDEASPIYSRGGEQRRTQTPRQIGVKSAPHNIPKGGTTISDRDPEGKRLFTGDQDRGKGSKAAKRAAALKPKEKSFPNRLRRADGQGIRDSYDYYDIILSHLLDEGYAETQEQAEAIMVNMGEEWRDSIVEETKRTEYLQKKFNKENERKSGSALKYIPGKQNTGQALQKSRESEGHMRGER